MADAGSTTATPVLNQTLVRIYANLVINGRRALDKVPTEYQAAVQTEIAKEQA